MIDLHTHTTASDGCCSPEDLVSRARAAGVAVLAVTDHDTVAGCEPAAEACCRSGIEFVPGIEITAVVAGADVHVLGYFVDVESNALLTFLAEQRRHRIDRLREMIGRLGQHGIAIDADQVLGPGLSDSSKAAGRPWIARALVAQGHVSSVSEAFDQWLSRGRPAFVPRTGAPPEKVVARIHEAGGVASLAHPVLCKLDDRIPQYADAGLDALEAYHSDHDAATTDHYLRLAASLNLAITGGSDFHADDEHGGEGPGSVSLPRADYERLVRLHAARRATASGSTISS